MKNIDPNHIAIIMDGNGRWAESKKHSRLWGHIKGSQTAQDIVEAAINKNISYLTLFAFSTENWKRPVSEVQFLIKLLERHIKKRKADLLKQNVRVLCVGDLTPFPDHLKNELSDIQKATSKCTGLTLIFALNYGGKQEILQAAFKAAQAAFSSSSKLTSKEKFLELFESHLEFSTIPDPDLIIRTSGEQRISNFMLWSSAYSELYFSPKFWPDFSKQDFFEAINEYSCRQRRFGGLKHMDPIKESLA